MLRSKATAALLRLKEMDKKYNIKRNEGKQAQSNISTESSLEDYPKVPQDKSKVLNGRNTSKDGQISLNIIGQKEITPKVSPKSKMEVRIPMNHAKNNDSSVTDSAPSKISGKISFQTKSIDKTIDSDKSIELEAEDNVLKSHSSSKILSNIESVSEVMLETPAQESFDSPRNNVESSVATVFSRRSEISETIAESVKSVNEHSSRKSDEKSIVQKLSVTGDSALAPDSDSGGTTIEEAIRITEEKSEIISELSTVMDKNISAENVSSRDDQKIRYEDDTFEEASTSSWSSITATEKLKKASEGGTIVSGVKQIKITPHKQTESTQKIEFDEDRNKEIVELVAPKILQSTSECDIGLDEELSNYVRTTENVDEALPISLLKLCKQTTPRKHVRRNKRHRKLSAENTEEKTDSSVASEHEKLTERKENSTEDNVLAANGFTTSTKCEKKDSLSRNEQGKAERVDAVETEIVKNVVENVEPEPILSEEKLLTETPKKSDVTSTLRKLNKDAIDAIVRRHRVQTSRDVSSKSRHRKNCGTVVKLPPADGPKNMEDDNSCASSCENFKDHRSREKKVKTKKYARSSKNKKSSNYNKVEGKHSRFECRQAHRLRKYAAMLRLQQEREDVRNYLVELERTRLKFGPGASVASSQMAAFKPLDFPKIAAFLKPEVDMDESSLKNKDEIARLQERLVIIRQWLKDQYILYRDYSNLAKTVNAKYIPANLEDAKRTIRQLQKATIKSR